MNAVEFAKGGLDQAFNLLNVAADGMTDQQYNYGPGGTCNSSAKSHVHALTAVDFFVLSTAGGQPMMWGEVAADQALPANPMEIWKYEGEISLPKVKEYGQKVREATMAYVSSLLESDLSRELDTPFGKQNLAFVLQLMTVHLASHTGDLASVKGIQGLKGLPF